MNSIITSLHDAIQNQETELASALIAQGANINKMDDKGNTPLHLAAEAGNKKIFKLLLDFGAEVDLKNKMGLTPMHCLIRNRTFSGAVHLASELINHGAILTPKTIGTEILP